MTSSSAEARSSTGSTTRSSPTRLMLLWAVPAGLAITLVGALAAWLVVDGMAALSALVGGVLSLGVFGLGIVAIRGLLSGPGQIVMSGAFFVFLVQLALTAGVLFLLSRSEQVSLMALGLTFIAVGLSVQVGTVVGALRARVSVDVDSSTSSVSVTPTTKGADR
ncbi:hypothetical protein [Ornithinimicrobium pratense]|uniref:Uncharacterized protein n=1 Tax=Ornithinimicrobium pratense TaxID=2593973 RepID=A0A5J6V2C3_9MICO|nr:hypothetical protein [Ornithinimicrobium pratense]QFG67827.1 hypothetical protein FY030_03000 [Ornithinimicrobium pratense]